MIGAATQQSGFGFIVVVTLAGIATCFVRCIKIAHDAEAWKVRPWESHKQTVIRRGRL